MHRGDIAGNMLVNAPKDNVLTPWYQRTRRWGQTNLTENDPAVYDLQWWIEHWRRTAVQGVIINAGGIVAYYPSKFDLHYRAELLGERDLYGEIVRAARSEGLTVLARMDSNRAHQDLFVEHPEWFAVDRNGEPYRAQNRYVACINSEYYQVFLADILREIIERSAPDGITDNSWSGLGNKQICYCSHCQSKFRQATGFELPEHPSWDLDAYRRWIIWSYETRLALWEFNNSVTRESGGEHCLWIGMNSGDPIRQAEHLRDCREVCRRAEIFMLDFQTRPTGRGHESNREAGALLHQMLGWEKIIPESMAMYDAGKPTFRVAAKAKEEVQLWAAEGMAGGISPWWHHVGSTHDDRRQYDTAPGLFLWHRDNEDVLYNRKPLAQVGVLWSQRNIDFYGRDEPEVRVSLPYRGVCNALLEARIPYLPVHADDVPLEPSDIRVLWLPNVASLSEEQCARIRSFYANGGVILASGETSLYDEWGLQREDFALADVLGVHADKRHHGDLRDRPHDWEVWTRHSYLRLHRQTGEVAADIHSSREVLLGGLEGTDIIAFGGRIEIVNPRHTRGLLATFMPPFPMYPPETSWIRRIDSDVPALMVHEDSLGRSAYLAADLDRCFGRDATPDCGRILANLTRWALAGQQEIVQIEGSGLVDVQVYSQDRRRIVHLVNLNHPGAWRPPVRDLVSIGPLIVRVAATELGATKVELRVSGRTLETKVEGRWESFVVDSITDHEMAVIGE